MQVHGALRNRQAEPRSAAVGITRLFHAKERIETRVKAFSGARTKVADYEMVASFSSSLM